jgi:hypothetical protein
MKWSNRIAQGFSPGCEAKPQDRPESGDRMCIVESMLEVMNDGRIVDARAGRNDRTLTPLSGRNLGMPYPGLKPLGYSLRPFHGQEPATAH